MKYISADFYSFLFVPRLVHFFIVVLQTSKCINACIFWLKYFIISKYYTYIQSILFLSAPYFTTYIPWHLTFQFYVFLIFISFSPLSPGSAAHMHKSARVIHRSMTSLPVVTFLKTSDSPFPSSHQLPIASWPGVDLWELLPNLCWNRGSLLSEYSSPYPVDIKLASK